MDCINIYHGIIPKKSPLWEIQEINDIYLMGIFVVTTSIGPLMDLVFLKICQLSNGQLLILDFSKGF
jgi:hypothetical protein